jgi:ATP-dependent DNA ligase
VERKARRATLLKRPLAGIAYTDHEGGDGEAFRKAARAQGLESVVSEQLDRPNGLRRAAWLKSKRLNRAAFVIESLRQTRSLAGVQLSMSRFRSAPQHKK